jgi:uncharacterized protein HemY
MQCFVIGFWIQGINTGNQILRYGNYVTHEVLHTKCLYTFIISSHIVLTVLIFLISRILTKLYRLEEGDAIKQYGVI